VVVSEITRLVVRGRAKLCVQESRVRSVRRGTGIGFNILRKPFGGRMYGSNMHRQADHLCEVVIGDLSCYKLLCGEHKCDH